MTGICYLFNDVVDFILTICGQVYELILQYMIENKIPFGEYNVVDFITVLENMIKNRTEILAGIQLEVLSEPSPFDVHQEALQLYTFHQNSYWSDLKK